jgi:hypothetical protein
MLQLRPNCEHCNKDLPPDSTEARICSFECTFCRDCVADVLQNVCPNCGGGFVARPVRPTQNWKNQNNLQQYPASEKRVLRPVDASVQQALIALVGDLAPEAR